VGKKTNPYLIEALLPKERSTFERLHGRLKGGDGYSVDKENRGKAPVGGFKKKRTDAIAETDLRKRKKPS